MKFYFFFFLFLFWQQAVCAQPYLDVAAVRYQTNPAGGIFDRGLHRTNTPMPAPALNLPLVLKDSSVLMWSPTLETWHIKSRALPQVPDDLRGIALPLAFVKPFNPLWTATFLAIPRWNGPAHLAFKDPFQMGAAVLLAQKAV